MSCIEKHARPSRGSPRCGPCSTRHGPGTRNPAVTAARRPKASGCRTGEGVASARNPRSCRLRRALPPLLRARLHPSGRLREGLDFDEKGGVRIRLRIFAREFRLRRLACVTRVRVRSVALVVLIHALVSPQEAHPILRMTRHPYLVTLRHREITRSRKNYGNPLQNISASTCPQWSAVS